MLTNIASAKNRPVCLDDPLIPSFNSLFTNSLVTYPASYHPCKPGGGRERQGSIVLAGRHSVLFPTCVFPGVFSEDTLFATVGLKVRVEKQRMK